MSAVPKEAIRPDDDQLAGYAARLMDLFAGEEARHGTYDPARLRLVGGKKEMKDENGNGARNMDGPPSEDLWRLHLSGEVPLGISPLREDGMCRWGVVDVDDYNLSHSDLVAAIEREKFPLIACRSKSGGLHLYLFLTDWAPQAEVQAALRAAAGRLMLPSVVEVYPPAIGKGNWINMPYVGGGDTDRYAVKKGGLSMTIGEFLAAADRSKVLADSLLALGRAKLKAVDRKTAGPERAVRDLERLTREIAACRGRGVLLNKHAFLMGRMVGAGWIGEDEVFSRLLKAATADSVAPMNWDEATGHIKSGIDAGRKEPLPEEADADRYPRIESIVVWCGGEDVLWEVALAGRGTIKLPVKEVMHFWTFNMRCAEKLRTSFRQMKNDAWSDHINAALAEAEERRIPVDETVEWIFREALREFCMNRHRGDTMGDVILSKPADIEEESRTYFRFGDFCNFVAGSTGPLKGASVNKLGRLFSGIGRENVDYGKTTLKIKGATTEVRWIRYGFFEVEEPADIPPIPGEAI